MSPSSDQFLDQPPSPSSNIPQYPHLETVTKRLTMSLRLMLPAPIEARQPSPVSTGGAAELQLSQEQSLCLVKIFLNASLGCICFARGLIPSNSPSYRDRRVDDLVLITLTSAPTSYHKFLSFQGQLSVNIESQPFKVLVGGKDKRADQILNLVVSHFRAGVSVCRRDAPCCSPHSARTKSVKIPNSLTSF